MDIKTMHWGWVILIFIIFFPIGLILSFIKLRPSNSILRTLFILVAFSIGLYLCFVAVLVLPYLKPSELFVFIITFLIGALFLLLAKKLDKTAFKVKMYSEFIINQGLSDIENITIQTALPYDTVIKDLQWLISTSKLENYSIDFRNKLVCYNYIQTANSTNKENHANNKTTNKVAINCSNCGANISVDVGKVTLCVFCDTPNNP